MLTTISYMKVLRILYSEATSILWAKPTSAVDTAILHAEASRGTQCDDDARCWPEMVEAATCSAGI